MAKQYFKAILLVLASHNAEIYQEFRKIYHQYYKTNPNILVLFVYGKTPNLIANTNDLIYDDILENYYPGMITKTIRAIKHIESSYDYDFLIRTNISTFWIFDRLLQRLEKTPNKDCFLGSLRTCKMKNGEYSPQYLSGINMTLSRDVIPKLIEQENEVISHSHMPEDWALSQSLINHGYIPKAPYPPPVHHLDTFTTIDERVMKEIELADSRNRDHFRIKNRENRVDIDISIAKILLQRYYGKTVL